MTVSYRPLLSLSSEAEYRAHFEREYCSGPVTTFDGLQVRFKKRDFDHCCFESSKRDGVKDTFSHVRAQRLNWIKAVLQDPNAERYKGWDKTRKRYDSKRRVAVVVGMYVVVIALTSTNTARFITAYWADTLDASGESAAVKKIRQGPKWA